MTTKVMKCPTCGGDAVDRSDFIEAVVPDSDKMRTRLYGVEKAINKYHLALDRREHGGVAQNKAVQEIQELLGMNWEQGKMLERLERHPGLKKIYSD